MAFYEVNNATNNRFYQDEPDIYFVKCQHVILEPLPPKKSAKFAH